MNLRELFEEASVLDPEGLKKLVDAIKTNCQPWLNSAGTNFIFRGMNSRGEDLFHELSVRKDRTPKDMNPETHKLLDNLLKDQYGIAGRSGSLFVSGNRNLASDYGYVYIVFPIGDFEYVASHTIGDLYAIFARSWEYAEGINYGLRHKIIFNHEPYLKIANAVEPLYRTFYSKIQKDFEEELKEHITDTFLEKANEGNIKTIGLCIAVLQEVVDNPDLIKEINDFNESVVRLLIKTYTTDKEDLVELIKSGNEIMLSCDKYYAVRLSMLHTIVNGMSHVSLLDAFRDELEK